MKLKCSLFAKITACCLMVVFMVASVVATVFAAYALGGLEAYRKDYRDTLSYTSAIGMDANYIGEYYSLLDKEKSAALTEEEQNQKDFLRGHLFPPSGTNLAWVLLDTAGNPLVSNLAAQTPTKEQVASLTGDQYAQIQSNNGYVVIGMRSDRPVSDTYSDGYDAFQTAKTWLPTLLIAGGICLLLSVVLFGFLIAASGHKAGVEGIALSPFDRIWLEPMVGGYLIILAVWVVSSGGNWSYFSEMIWQCVGLALVLLPLSFLVFFSVVRRAKAGALYKTSMLALSLRIFRAIMRHTHLMVRVVGIMAAYGLVQLILIFGIAAGSFFAALLWLFSNMGLLALVCVVAIQYDHLRRATERMASGEFGQLVNENSVPFFHRVARNLNNTGSSISLAVERAMQSERMKTDLIANVSHDIKTPLTSIISYVDLLKTTGIQDEKALEYIDVLDRKSRRLGQLMTDLVEASKVTTGNVSVNMEIINLGELVKQAGGEFESRLEQRGIRMVCTLPDMPVCVRADGRHMWRVLDNLFSNASKYALDGTRVYVDVSVINQDVLLSVKNISRDALNIRPDELMERFVRGDESRHTEGSGLGLSIARSLMELQNGTMNIFIDGDLFKVVLGMKKSDQPCEPVAGTVGSQV